MSYTSYKIKSYTRCSVRIFHTAIYFFLNPCSHHSSRQRILRSFPTCNPPFSECILSFLWYLLLSIKRIAWISTYIIFVSCPVCFDRPVCIRLWLSLSSYFIKTTQNVYQFSFFSFFHCNICSYLFILPIYAPFCSPSLWVIKQVILAILHFISSVFLIWCVHLFYLTKISLYLMCLYVKN